MIKRLPILVCAVMALATAACNQTVPDDGDGPPVADAPNAPDADDLATAQEDTEGVSILRSEDPPSDEQGEALEKLNAVIGFPDGGDVLDADAVAELEKVAASAQIKRGGPIVLRAHSDSEGTDTANEDAAEARGLAVAAWLINQGVEAERIDVIVFGEQNPAKPNALPDGSPNEAGRRANRRVEIEVSTLVLTVSSTDDVSTETGD